MNKITLLTTEGCLGCQVMKNSIESALVDAKVKVTVEVIDKSELTKPFIKLYRITDFPTVLFFKDDKFLFKWVGSVPSIVVLRWINVNFK